MQSSYLTHRVITLSELLELLVTGLGDLNHNVQFSILARTQSMSTYISYFVIRLQICVLRICITYWALPLSDLVNCIAWNSSHFKTSYGVSDLPSSRNLQLNTIKVSFIRRNQSRVNSANKKLEKDYEEHLLFWNLQL